MVQKVNLPFDGIETLMINSDYNILVMPGTNTEDAFKNSKDPIMQKAWLDRIEPNMDFYKEYLKAQGKDYTLKCKKLQHK